MRMKSKHGSGWVALVLSGLVGVATAQDDAPKQITGPNPATRATLRLFTDMDLKVPYAAQTTTDVAATKFPRPVLKTAPSGAVQTMVELKGGALAPLWLHPSEVKTGLRADGNCLVAQASVGAVGVTRGANESCQGPKK